MSSMKEKQEAYLKDLLIRGIVDNRKVAVCSNAKKLPNGEYGLIIQQIPCGHKAKRKLHIFPQAVFHQHFYHLSVFIGKLCDPCGQSPNVIDCFLSCQNVVCADV